MACCWSSIRVTSSMNHAPSARPVPVRHAGLRADLLDLDRPAPAMHSARSASGARIVVEAVVGLGDAPQPGRAPHRRRRSRRRAACVPRTSDPPRPGLLADPAHLAAEQPGLAAGVGELGVGQRLGPGRARGTHRLGQAVGDPVVGDRRPVVLDVVASRRQVVADAIGDLAEALVGEQQVQAGQRPVRLARVVLRAAVRLGSPSTVSYWATTAPVGSVWLTRKRPKPRIRSSWPSSPVSSRRSTSPATSSAVAADRRAGRRRQRRPPVVLDEVRAQPRRARGRRSRSAPSMPAVAAW